MGDFQDTEQDMEDKLQEQEQQVTKFKEIAANRLKKLEQAADATKKLHVAYVKTRRAAAKMEEDIALIQKVAPQAFQRVVAHQKGIKLQPENENVLIEQSATSPTNVA